jgi:toxin ParE1/3/4
LTAHKLAPQAAADLDDIWFYVARESGSIETANRLIDSITDRFLLLARHPYLGRSRDDDFARGTRSFPVGEYVIVYCVQVDEVLILRVAHGRRDLGTLFED